MNLAILLNAGGGTIAHLGQDAVYKTIVEATAALGVHAEVHWYRGPALAEAAAVAVKRALAGEIDGVVVGGGDGTLSTAAGALARTKVPLGILPLGTLNHFARDLAIPSDIASALAVIAGGNTREVDLAEVNGRIFINNSSIGLYPDLVARRGGLLRIIPKSLATAIAAGGSFIRFPLRRLHVSSTKLEATVLTACLLVSNNAYDAGGLTRRAKLDSGELWISVAEATTRSGFLRLAMALALRRMPKALDVWQTTTAEVRSRARRLRIALDGEVVTMDSPLVYRSKPKALTVFAPVAAS